MSGNKYDTISSTMRIDENWRSIWWLLKCRRKGSWECTLCTRSRGRSSSDSLALSLRNPTTIEPTTAWAAVWQASIRENHGINVWFTEQQIDFIRFLSGAMNRNESRARWNALSGHVPLLWIQTIENVDLDWGLDDRLTNSGRARENPTGLMKSHK